MKIHERKPFYYIYRRDDGSIGRIVKFDNGVSYGYENGEWVHMPGLVKILMDITDYKELDERDLESAISEYNNQTNN